MSQSKSFGKSIQAEDPEFEVADTYHKVKKGIWVMMMKNPRERLHLNMTGLPNLNNLKNPLILIGMLARLHNKDQLKAG
ncbi:hypothetical protein Tco_0387639 [Tanacetum coccineum]